jgi:hypothetical protein
MKLVIGKCWMGMESLSPHTLLRPQLSHLAARVSDQSTGPLFPPMMLGEGAPHER